MHAQSQTFLVSALINLESGVGWENCCLVFVKLMWFQLFEGHIAATFFQHYCHFLLGRSSWTGSSGSSAGSGWFRWVWPAGLQFCRRSKVRDPSVGLVLWKKWAVSAVETQQLINSIIWVILWGYIHDAAGVGIHAWLFMIQQMPTFW